MKKYHYVEFIDGRLKQTSLPKYKGRLYIVAEKPESYIEEFSLAKDGTEYYTNLEKIGALGWELVSVTPCGNFYFSEGKNNMLYNAYVFKKEIEE